MASASISHIPVAYDDSALPLLQGTLRELFEAAIVELQCEAERLGVAPTVVGVSRFQSYEDDTDQLVITHEVDLDAEDALDYWEHLARALASWRATLAPELQSLALNGLEVSVNWPIDTSTV